MSLSEWSRIIATYLTYQCPVCMGVVDIKAPLRLETCPFSPTCPGKPAQVLKGMGLKPPPETAK